MKIAFRKIVETVVKTVHTLFMPLSCAITHKIKNKINAKINYTIFRGFASYLNRFNQVRNPYIQRKKFLA